MDDDDDEDDDGMVIMMYCIVPFLGFWFWFFASKVFYWVCSQKTFLTTNKAGVRYVDTGDNMRRTVSSFLSVSLCGWGKDRLCTTVSLLRNTV